MASRSIGQEDWLLLKQRIRVLLENEETTPSTNAAAAAADLDRVTDLNKEIINLLIDDLRRQKLVRSGSFAMSKPPALQRSPEEEQVRAVRREERKRRREEHRLVRDAEARRQQEQRARVEGFTLRLPPPVIRSPIASLLRSNSHDPTVDRLMSVPSLGSSAVAR